MTFVVDETSRVREGQGDSDRVRGHGCGDLVEEDGRRVQIKGL